mgnify:CR=1 FL=1
MNLINWKEAILKWIVVIIVCSIAILFSGCYGTYYLTDAEYTDAREEGASITYYNNQIYSGWNSGYYYYYGKPHYYPWHYYYNTCPPSYYNITTHIVINRPVNRPTHRPNRPNRPNRNVIVKPNRSKTTNKVIINKRRPK